MKISTEMITRVHFENGTEFLRLENGKHWIELDRFDSAEQPFVYEVHDPKYLEIHYSNQLEANLAK